MDWRHGGAGRPRDGGRAVPEVQIATPAAAGAEPQAEADGRGADPRPAPRRRIGRSWRRGASAAALAVLLLAGGAAVLRPSPVAHAQTSGVGGTAHTITVMGTDRQSVAPDQADVTLGVTTQASTAAASQSQNSQTSAAVIAAVESLGVAAADIQTTGYDLSPRYRQPRPGAAQTISGFETAHMLTVTVRNIKQVGAVVDAAVKAGANEVQGVAYTVSDASKIQLDSYAAAIKDARARADAIAGALGVSVSGPYSVDATNSSWIRPPLPYAVAMPAAAQASAPIQPGRQTIQTQVQVVFSFS